VIDAWTSSGGELQTVPRVALGEVANGRRDGTVLDVRSEAEWKAGHIPGSLNVPLAEMERRLKEIPRGRLIVHCQSGGRAAMASSLLLARGFGEVQLFSGGFAEWRAAGHPINRAP
jgi:rhodanese-related sulfurtransferase